MNFINYLKERWLTYVFALAGFAFSFIVYKLDNNFSITDSNATYILFGIALIFAAFIAIDYAVLNLRVKKFKLYCELNAASFDLDEFAYPMDREYAKMVHGISLEYEKYKSDIYIRSSEELEFITKWVHDIKVPISAICLILESNDNKLPHDFFEKLDTEIAAIEQCTQTVFYNIKSNTFYNDYRIAEVSTRKLIADSLKGYSNFFAYKKINIKIVGESYTVLTDEKWSGYIISQILSNAVKYTPVNGNITITVSKNNDQITIAIRNSGKGILPLDIGQVFNKGYTTSENRNGMKATGYGMYLSKKLSDMLGHKLTVESEYGSYAQFTLTIPCTNTIYNVTKM